MMPPSHPNQPMPAVQGSVDSPIVIEDMEDPLASIATHKEDVVIVDRDSSIEKKGGQSHVDIVEVGSPAVDSREKNVEKESTAVEKEGVLRQEQCVTEPTEVAQSSHASLDEAPSVSGPRDVSIPNSVEEESITTVVEQEDAASAVCVEVEEETGGNNVMIVTQSSEPSFPDNPPVAAASTDPADGLSTTGSCDVKIDNDGDNVSSSELMDSDSCQPGPAPVMITASRGEDPGNHDDNESHVSTTESPQTVGDTQDGNDKPSGGVVNSGAELDEKTPEETQHKEIADDIENESDRVGNKDSQQSGDGEEGDQDGDPSSKVGEEEAATKQSGTSTEPLDPTGHEGTAEGEGETGITAGKSLTEVSPVHTLKEVSVAPETPPSEAQGDNPVSPKTTPGGILKYTSQFDTPTSSAGRGRRVQFASSPVVFEPTKEEESFKTPKQCNLRIHLQWNLSD